MLNSRPPRPFYYPQRLLSNIITRYNPLCLYTRFSVASACIHSNHCTSAGDILTLSPINCIQRGALSVTDLLHWYLWKQVTKVEHDA